LQHPETPKAYLAGRWLEARTALESLVTARRSRDGAVIEDGPARVLLTFMQQTGFQAPVGWAGYRELTEK